jgi:hypothetical protein
MRLVCGVLAVHLCECVLEPRVPKCRKARCELFFLVGKVQRKRGRKVAMDLACRVVDLIARRLAGGGQALRERQERSDALVAFAEQLHDTDTGNTLTELKEHRGCAEARVVPR